MAGSVNKVASDVDDAAKLYRDGMSLPMVAKATGIPLSTVRNKLNRMGILRSRAEGVRMAAKEGRLGDGLRGKSRSFTKAHCNAIAKARLAWGDENAAGFSVKPNGYLEYTRGPHKFRLFHVVKMEQRIGRRLKPDECVHHIDGNKLNNHENNLALMTRSGHSRLHRREERIAKGS